MESENYWLARKKWVEGEIFSLAMIIDINKYIKEVIAFDYYYEIMKRNIFATIADIIHIQE